jgi:hypothetical protein
LIADDPTIDVPILLQEAAKKHEFGAAAKLWGIRGRPQTVWGYAGPDYQQVRRQEPGLAAV